ncbi:MAG: hypothetical protein ACI4CA_01230 [Bacteroides sp.]
MKRIFLMLLAATCFIACDNDNEYQEAEFTYDAIDGEWLLCDENNPSTATEMTFLAKGYSYKCRTYVDINQTPKLYESYNGSYVYVKTTNTLRVRALGEKNGWQHTYDFEVKGVSQYSMLLINKHLNSYDIYYRIIKSINTTAGKNIGNSYLNECGLTARNFISANPNVATVDDNGNITTIGNGLTYIIADVGEEKIAIKITVDPMVKTYSECVYNASLYDITNMYGEPNAINRITETSISLYYENPSFDTNIEAVAFFVDIETEKVTRILTQYNSESAYRLDESFIKNNFYEVIFNRNLYYCDVENFLSSNVHIQPLALDDTYIIMYGSTFFWAVNNGSY